jgi:hypothetical protein
MTEAPPFRGRRFVVWSVLVGGLCPVPAIGPTPPFPGAAVFAASAVLARRRRLAIVAAAIRSAAPILVFPSVGFGAPFFHDLLLVAIYTS